MIATPLQTVSLHETKTMIGGNMEAIDTRFEICACLKGRVAGRTISVHHFRPVNDLLMHPEGATWIEFQPRSGTFLMFLKAQAGGGYGFAAGDNDPAISVKHLAERVFETCSDCKKE